MWNCANIANLYLPRNQSWGQFNYCNLNSNSDESNFSPIPIPNQIHKANQFQLKVWQFQCNHNSARNVLIKLNSQYGSGISKKMQFHSGIDSSSAWNCANHIHLNILLYFTCWLIDWVLCSVECLVNGRHNHRSPAEKYTPYFSTIKFSGLELRLKVAVLGSIDPYRYP